MTGADVVIPRHCPISAAFLMPVPKGLLSTPLDYIAAEHARQRCVCAYLKQMAASKTAARADADAIVVFMKTDLRLHHDDEDGDLFPALRKRLRQEDALDEVLDRLTEDHSCLDRLAAIIVSALRRHLDGPEPQPESIEIDDATSATMTSYAVSLLQHLSIENSIALVFARKRLTAGDLETLSHSMSARRRGLYSV